MGGDGWVGTTYNGSHVRDHAIRGDFAVIFQELAGYGIKIDAF